MLTPESLAAGSSPLTRGKQLRVLDCELGRGLIPAHAGKTTDENSAKGYAPGSSPLTRGKLERPSLVDHDQRLIPAHAGKTLGFARLP